MIPSDALGIKAFNLDNPLEYKDSLNDVYLFDIQSKSNFQMILRYRSSLPSSYQNYLGAIVSADRQTIYWVNNQ